MQFWLIKQYLRNIGMVPKGEVPVGAIFYDTQTQKIIARGCNSVNATKNATRHAEFNCIDQVLEKNTKNSSNYQWENIVVYVNVEPCIMCAGALVDLKVKTGKICNETQVRPKKKRFFVCNY